MPNKGPSIPVVLSPARRWLFTAVTILLPFLALGAAEVLLRLFGWGGYPAWIREAGKLPSGEGVCFVKPAAAERFRSEVRCAEEAVPLSVLSMVREWRSSRPAVGTRRPITATAARVLPERGRTAEAAQLYEIAARLVPAYTAWHLEYVYHAPAGRLRLEGPEDADRARAADAIAQGEFLLAQPVAAGAGDGSRAAVIFTLVGLRELRGTIAEVVPTLLVNRRNMSGGDLAAADQALVMAYLMTGRENEASALAEEGLAEGDRFKGHYRQLESLAEKGEDSRRTGDP